MADQFFDARERLKVIGANNPKQAVELAFLNGNEYLMQFGYKAHLDTKSDIEL